MRRQQQQQQQVENLSKKDVSLEAADDRSHEQETVTSSARAQTFSYSSSSSILNNIFSFLICSTDTIYLIMVVSLALFGSLILLYGCVRFYENDIKLLHHSLDETSSSSSFEYIILIGFLRAKELYRTILQQPKNS